MKEWRWFDTKRRVQKRKKWREGDIILQFNHITIINYIDENVWMHKKIHSNAHLISDSFEKIKKPVFSKFISIVFFFFFSLEQKRIQTGQINNSVSAAKQKKYHTLSFQFNYTIRNAASTRGHYIYKWTQYVEKKVKQFTAEGDKKMYSGAAWKRVAAPSHNEAPSRYVPAWPRWRFKHFNLFLYKGLKIDYEDS